MSSSKGDLDDKQQSDSCLLGRIYSFRTTSHRGPAKRSKKGKIKVDTNLEEGKAFCLRCLVFNLAYFVVLPSTYCLLVVLYYAEVYCSTPAFFLVLLATPRYALLLSRSSCYHQEQPPAATTWQTRSSLVLKPLLGGTS